jgi:galactose mutarotase-like enzyme
MADDQLVTIASDRLTAGVSPIGAELQRLTDSAGRELQWDGDPAVWAGRAPILFPVIGLLEGGGYQLDGQHYAMPKHGFARHAPFESIARSADAATFRLAASPETRALYPFEFRLDIGFSIAGATLTLSAAISNRGDAAMPASFGFHPAFRWPLPYGQPRADHALRFDREEPAPIRRINRDGFLLPDAQPTPVIGDRLALRDALFVDDALIFDRLASRHVSYGAAAGPRIGVAFADFPTLGVWTKPGAGFVCIEPWHGFSDPVGFSGDIRAKPGMFEVAPGATRTLAMRITLLPPDGG